MPGRGRIRTQSLAWEFRVDDFEMRNSQLGGYINEQVRRSTHRIGDQCRESQVVEQPETVRFDSLYMSSPVAAGYAAADEVLRLRRELDAAAAYATSKAPVPKPPAPAKPPVIEAKTVVRRVML